MGRYSVHRATGASRCVAIRAPFGELAVSTRMPLFGGIELDKGLRLRSAEQKS